MNNGNGIFALNYTDGWHVLRIRGVVVGGFAERMLAYQVLGTQPDGTKYSVSYVCETLSGSYKRWMPSPKPC